METTLDNGFLKTENVYKMKFYLMWANHDVLNLWDTRLADIKENNVIWTGKVDREEFKKICKRNIEKYFKHPQYYKIDGKPVFMIYDLSQLIAGLGGIDETANALEYFREETVRSGFTSGTHYQFCHFTNVDEDYNKVMKSVEKEWKRIEKTYDFPYYPHISVGWDNSSRTGKSAVIKNNTPKNFEKTLLKAREYADSHPKQVPLITINSWNEWTETSFLQPCNLYGYGYL